MVHLKKLCSSDKPCEPKICVYRLYKMRGCHTKTFCLVNRKSTISNKLGNNTTNYSSLLWFNYESWLFSVHLEWTKHLFSFCILTRNLKLQNKSWFVVIREEFRIKLFNCMKFIEFKFYERWNNYDIKIFCAGIFLRHSFTCFNLKQIT